MAAASGSVLAVAVLACRQLVGIGNDPPAPAGPTNDAGAEAGFTYGQGDCAACVASSCATQATACAGTPSCAKLETCLSGCPAGDATCRAQCGVDHGLGYDPGNDATPAFEACLAGSCGSQCGLTCGGLAALFPPATAPACDACFGRECDVTVKGCASNEECQAALRCQFSSRTPDVQLACPSVMGNDASSPTAPLFGLMPIASSCSTDCSWGADWSCKAPGGRVDWQNVTSGPIALPVTVFDIASTALTPGAAIKLCDITDLSCTKPFDAETTGTDGTTVLHRSPTASPARFYLDITAPALVPTLHFDTWPISQSQLVVHAGVLEPAELASSADLVMVTLDPALATLYVDAFDCRLAFAPNVVFHVDPPGSSRIVYIEDNYPSATATATTPRAPPRSSTWHRSPRRSRSPRRRWRSMAAYRAACVCSGGMAE